MMARKTKKLRTFLLCLGFSILTACGPESAPQSTVEADVKSLTAAQQSPA
jgi:hypothetical protein